MDTELADRNNNIQRVFREEGLDAVITALRITKSDNPMGIGMGYQLVDADGELLSGNMSGFVWKLGYYDVNGEALGLSDEQHFRFLTNDLGENLLTLGLNEQLLDDLRKNSISSFILTMLITTLLAVIGTMLLAYRSHKRIRHLATFMENVGQGNLDERLPISYRGDDIDKLSSNMNKSLGLLKQQVDGMKQVSFNIAHDLKTPLNRLSIKLEEAISYLKPGDPALTRLEVASDEAALINDTFEALLRIAQIEAGARRAKFKHTNLAPVILRACEVYEVVAEENDQIIKLDLKQQNIRIFGDEDLILQMIVNLIENAIRHCPAQSVITISAGLTGYTPWLSVCDTGPGIPEADRERVFERMYRLETSRTTKGSGLGLSMVKAVVDVHNGTVALSDNHPGLCVTVKLRSDELPA